MARAPIPRRPEFAQILVAFNRRIRRLEVNRTVVRAGTAHYLINPTDSDVSSWSPDWSAATKEHDTIGCETSTPGIVVPPEWLYWAHVTFEIRMASAPAAGDFLQWAAMQNGTAYDTTSFGTYKYDPLTDSSSGDGPPQTFGATVIGASGENADAGVFMQTVTTALGASFTPQAAAIAITAIQLYAPGFPSAGIVT